MKRISLRRIIGLLAIPAFLLAGCSGTGNKNAAQDSLATGSSIDGLRIGIDLTHISVPKTAKEYSYSMWKPESEQKICDLLLPGKTTKRTVWQMGPSYAVYDADGETGECLNFLDGGEEYSGKAHAGWGVGFDYIRTVNSIADSIYSNIFFSEVDLREMLENSTDQLSFGSIDSARQQALRLMKQVGLPENMELCFEGGFTWSALEKKAAMMGIVDPAEVASSEEEQMRADAESFLFVFREPAIDGIPRRGSVMITIDQHGLLRFMAGESRESDAKAEVPLISLTDAIRSAAPYFTASAEEHPTLTNAALIYQEDRGQNGYYVLIPVWEFKINITSIHDDTSAGKRYYYETEQTCTVRAETGKVMNTGTSALSILTKTEEIPVIQIPN